jgi:cell division transport system permease protein
MPYHIHNYKKSTEHLEHMTAMVRGFKQMSQRPATSLFLMFVITFSLFLLVSNYVLWKNVKALHSVLDQSAAIPLYLKKNTSTKAAADLAEKLKPNTAIMELKLISSDEGMQDFAKRTGFGEIVLGVKDNPLPNVIIIYPKLSELTESQIVELVNSLKNLPEVEAANIDMVWVKYSYQLLALWNNLMRVFVLLSIGAVIIFCGAVYITPQLMISQTNAKLSKQILQYQCGWHGFVGSTLAILLTNFILMVLHDLGFILQGIGIGSSIVVISSAVLLSVASVKFAMNKPGSRN